MRSEFEKAYEPNPHKSPFTEVRFNDEKQIYEPLNPPLDHVARSLNAAWYGYRIRQTEVDELTLQVAEMKSKLNDAYTDGQSAMYTARQSKVDELQRRNKMLNDNIKEQGQKLVYQNEVIETQAEKLLGLRDEKAELQKRVDELQTAFKQLIEMENESISFEHDLFDKGWNQSARQTIENIYKLTGLGGQALKGNN